MRYVLSDLLSELAKLDAYFRPLGFYDPQESPVAVYPELPIGHCESKPVFSGFEVEKCGLREQWHAHFPLVGSPALNTVLGIYLRDSDALVGFLSFPGQSDFDHSILKSINDFARVPEYSPIEIPGGESTLLRLGGAPSLDEVYVGATNYRNSSYVQVSCKGQPFEIFGLLSTISGSAEKPTLLTKATKLHLGELATLWRDQLDANDSYLAGFIFLSKELGGSIGHVPEVDHESLKRNSSSFAIATERTTPSFHCWRENAVLAMANYISNPSQELAVEASAWLKGASEWELSNFHFPDLEEIEGKSFPKSETHIRAKNASGHSCSNCGDAFELNSDKFCGSCGYARGATA